MEGNMPTILISNDDGINSPGLRTVVEAVLPLGEVIIVAPSSQQTSAGRSFSGAKTESFKPMDYKVGRTIVKAYHCACSPARAILHAFDVLFHLKKPDLLVSGVNYGENLGTNVTISGTIGAALQGAAHGVRGLAVSLQTRDMADHFKYPELDWTAVRHFAGHFAQLMLTKRLPADVDILNVNVPASATIATQSKWTRLSRQPYFSDLIKEPTLLSTIGDAKCCHGFDEKQLEPDSDIFAFRQGFVTVSPISMDLTARVDLNQIQMIR